jgi:hypothetical protein
MAAVYLEKRDAFDISHWQQDFEKTANKAYGFRGVELTIKGKAQALDNRLTLNSQDVPEPIELAPLKHKLQWNFRKGRAREREPEEAAAYDQLLTMCCKNKDRAAEVLVTGPLRNDKAGLVLEVRESFLVTH